ncbi:MAG: TIGR00725 family protein [Desulfohalobiaceae bacterium]
MRRKRVAIIGSGSLDSSQYAAARELGLELARAGLDIVCGGLGGAMQGVCEGAQQGGGYSIGILPGQDIQEANPYVSCPIATGLGPMRNYLVVLNSDLVLAFAGGSGTLSEIGLAQKIGRTVVAFGNWADLPGVVPARDVQQAVQLVLDRLCS